MTDATTEVNTLLVRLAAGEPAARDELFARTQERFRALASRMQHHGFARVGAFEQTDDVMQTVLLRLWKSWNRVTRDESGAVLTDAGVFLCRVSRLLREVLLDLARHHYGRGGQRPANVPLQPAGDSSDAGGFDPGSDTLDPQRLALLTDFHAAVEALPENLRQVVDLHWYQDCTHPQVGAILGIGESTSRKYWVAARLQLTARLGSNPFATSGE